MTEKGRRLRIGKIKLSLEPSSVQWNKKLLWNLRRVKKEEYDFFTIGYSEKSLEQLLEFLKEAGIKALIDIRHNPVSIHKPEFNRGHLEEVLNKQGISYIHLPELGVPQEIRVRLATTKDWNWFFAWYDQNIIPKFVNGLYKKLIEQQGMPLAFMCVEINPERCHRHRIALALENKGLKGYEL